MAAFDWTNLINNTVAPMGGKILGEAIAPDPGLMTAKQGVQNSQFGNALNLAKFNASSKAQALALPGMLRTLGYSPANADVAARSWGEPITAGSGGFPSVSGGSGTGLGSNVGKAAVGAGMSVGLPLLGAALAPSTVPLSGLVGGAIPGAVAGGGAGAGGAMGAIGALATNPFTWAAAGGLAGALLWKKSQVHPTADQWVHGEQNPFDQTMSNIDVQVKNGSMTPDEAKALKTQNAQTYLGELQKFSQQGSHQAIVARQAAQTFRQYYGDPSQYGVALNF